MTEQNQTETIYKSAQTAANTFIVVKYANNHDRRDALARLLLTFFDSGCLFEQANRIELETLLHRASTYVTAAKTGFTPPGDKQAARELLDEISEALNNVKPEDW